MPKATRPEITLVALSVAMVVVALAVACRNLSH
jgi:hypothetical protein